MKELGPEITRDLARARRNIKQKWPHAKECKEKECVLGGTIIRGRLTKRGEKTKQTQQNIPKGQKQKRPLTRRLNQKLSKELHMRKTETLGRRAWKVKGCRKASLRKKSNA